MRNVISSILTVCLFFCILAECVHAVPTDPAYLTARIKLAKLVEKFQRDESFYTSSKFNEKKTRFQFIDEFFIILGWDVRNVAQVFLYRQEVVPETRLKTDRNMRYADYGFQVGGRAEFYVEAKAAHQRLNNPKHIFQAKRYSFSSQHAELAVLTDFEDFRVYDARTPPDINKPENGLLKAFDLNYRKYIDYFDLLWTTFSREAVMNGSIDRLLKETDPGKVRVTADHAFLQDMDLARLMLGRNIHERNPELAEEQLNQASLHILNQLIFARILEDRDVEPTGRLRIVVDMWQKDKNGSLFRVMQKEFGRLQKRYLGVIFREHFSDDLSIEDDVLQEIVLNLYPPRSPYILAVIPIPVLGETYEQHLARQLVIEDGQVVLSKKPKIRKAGGVFYTPEWITKYIVSRTLGPKLAGKTPAELASIKTLDLACGSGAFTVEVIRQLLAYARDYYAQNPNTIQGKETEFPDAYQLPDGRFKLSVKKKIELIQDSVFCLDVDPMAVEITKMWIYVLILESEASYVVTAERKYKVLFRVWPETIKTFKLPNLNQNIVWGNSLVGPDFSDNPAELERVQAFDWEKDNQKLSAIVKSGGFDVLVGNPPYLSTRTMRKVIPDQYRYFRKHYKSLSAKQPDLSFGFVEKGVSLLRKEGRLGYIITNRFLSSEAGENLRQLIIEGGLLEEIINFGSSPIFEGVKVTTATIILNNAGNATFKFAKVNATDRPEEVLHHMNEDTWESNDSFVRTVPSSQLIKNRWGFTPPRQARLLAAMEAQPIRLRDVAVSFAGVKTGANKVFIVSILREDGNKVLVFSNQTKREHWLEKDILRPLMRSRDVVRHRHLQNKSWLIWAYDDEWNLCSEDIMETSFPFANAYLLESKARLMKRRTVKSGRTAWYGLETPGSVEIMSKPKLVTGWKKGQTSIGIDLHGGMFMLMTGMSAGIVPQDGSPSLEALMGLLGSAAVRVFVETYSPEFNGGDHIFPPTILDTIPIVPLTPASTPPL